MPNINTFQDILDALEQDPALREQLRWHILTDELLQLPAAVLEIRTDVAGLKNDVAEIKTSVASLQEGQARLETDVARMGGDLARMNGDLRRLTGKDYEDYVLRFAERLMNRNTDFERLSVAGSDKNGWAHPHMRERNTEAAISGTITFEEADDLEMTDVVLSGRTPPGRAPLRDHRGFNNRPRRRRADSQEKGGDAAEGQRHSHNPSGGRGRNHRRGEVPARGEGRAVHPIQPR